jgi:alpha-glucosidase
VLGNHDRTRVASREGTAQLRVAAMLLLTLRGTPTLYQGEELGMENVPVPADRVRDPWELNVPGLGLGRDPVRTPMLWSGEANAGFSTAEPWLPLSANWGELNAERQAALDGSTLSFYRELLALRRHEPALWRGDHVPIAATDSLLAYERRTEAESLTVVLDLSGQGGDLHLPAGEIVLATAPGFAERHTGGAITVPPNQGMIIRPDRA